MIDNVWLEGTKRLANYNIKKVYPLMGENHYSNLDVKLILESFLMLWRGYEIQRSEQSNNRHDEPRRSKSLRKVPKK
uniref:Uncharacterized protein n=1 Tax=viral metagenome TaxID=1070528 RepID=A0A6H2A2F6_9ZZZZ